MPGRGRYIDVEIDLNDAQLQAVQEANDKLPGDCAQALNARAADAGRELAREIAAAARRSDRQSALMARTVDVDLAGASVSAGGSTPVGRNNTPADNILFGSEFGSRRYRQFRRKRSSGYWFNPTYETELPDIMNELAEAADDAVKNWDELEGRAREGIGAQETMAIIPVAGDRPSIISGEISDIARYGWDPDDHLPSWQGHRDRGF